MTDIQTVLSAVDAHTAHAIMENCLQGPMVQGRTTLMVSHHTTLVSPAAAYIVALENVSRIQTENRALTGRQGDVKFAGTRSEFVAGGLMAELDAEDLGAKPTESEKKKETIVEETAMKPANKSLVNLTGAVNPEPESETSSIAPEDEDTLANSDADLKKSRAPRKLIEDEKRAKGRIAWPVWRTYFTVSDRPIEL